MPPEPLTIRPTTDADTAAFVRMRNQPLLRRWDVYGEVPARTVSKARGALPPWTPHPGSARGRGSIGRYGIRVGVGIARRDRR
jgi:hypothetical protein